MVKEGDKSDRPSLIKILRIVHDSLFEKKFFGVLADFLIQVDIKFKCLNNLYCY